MTETERRRGVTGKTILVIDDTDIVRTGVMLQLERLGFVTRGADNGEVGLAEVAREAPSLVLCDLRMPRMDGLQFLTAMRRDYGDIPVIVMSGAGLVGDAIGALKLGAWDYLEKPIAHSGVLEHAINRALERGDLIEENRGYREHLERINGELRATLRLLSDDEEAGRQMQFRLLPKDGLRFGRYQVTRGLFPSAFLSGDFVDTFAIDEHRWAFYLADVAGHGVSSALVTVLLRSWIQHQAAEHLRTKDGLVTTPGRLLERLNEQVFGDDLGKHLTMFYGVVDGKDDTLRYASAGHYPWPFLYDGEKVAVLEQPGVPIGMMARTRYRENVLTLPERAVLTVISDGLLEILPHERLDQKQAFLRALFGRADVTIDRVRTELRLEGRELPDDIAILLIKRGETP